MYLLASYRLNQNFKRIHKVAKALLLIKKNIKNSDEQTLVFVLLLPVWDQALQFSWNFSQRGTCTVHVQISVCRRSIIVYQSTLCRSCLARQAIYFHQALKKKIVYNKRTLYKINGLPLLDCPWSDCAETDT